MMSEIPEVTNERGFLDAALWYAAAGYRVHPLRPASKRPALDEWQNKASADSSVISGWWGGQQRGRNIGVLTGQSNGLLVVDVDTKNDINGMVSLAEWENSAGVQLPEAPVVRTPSGGRHLWFRLDTPCKSVGGWLPGVDIRADGGQVAAVPSMVEMTVLDSSARGGRSIVPIQYELLRGSLTDLPAAPIELIAAINRDGGRFGVAGGTSRQRTSRLPAINEFLRDGFRPGQRDIDCYRLACSLWRKYWGNSETVEGLIRVVWERTPQTPTTFTWEEALHKINGARLYIGRERAATVEQARRLFGGGSK